MEIFFTNQIKIKTDIGMVKKVLLNIDQLMIWNPGIDQIDKLSVDTFIVYRFGDVYNNQEVITVKNQNNRVIFQSLGGRLEYRLVFELTNQKNSAGLVERFYLTNKANFPQIILLAPIAKYAFDKNLKGLKRLLEFQVTKL